MFEVHSQHLFYPILVRTRNWNALNIWTHLHWNNQDKNNENSQVAISRKSAGNFLCWPHHGLKFTSHSRHPLGLVHEEICVGQRNENHETEDIQWFQWCLFPFLLSEQLLGKLNVHRKIQSSLQPRDPPTPPPHSPHQGLTDRSVHTNREETTCGLKWRLY